MTQITFRRFYALLICAIILPIWQLIGLVHVGAVTTNTTVRPISTIANSGWTTAGTPGGSCSGVCDYVDEASTDGDTSYLNGANSAGPSAEFGMGGALTSGQTATTIVVHVVGRAAATSGLGYPPLSIVLKVGSDTRPAQSVTFNSTTYQDLSATFTGVWPKTDVDNSTVTITKGVNALQPAMRISTVYADVTYQSPIHSQNAARLYANANNVAPGAPLAATNTPAEIATNVPFRLRLGLTPSDTDWTTGSWGAYANTYKLQYTQLTAASCTLQATGWADIAAGSGAIRWYDNTSVANNVGISSIGTNDPTTSGAKVYQTYRESNGFTNTSTVAVGSSGIWDFSLISSGQPAGLSFCFRVINNDGTFLSAYPSYPQITLTGDVGTEIVDASGTTVPSPVVSFSSTVAATTQCNSSTATLGLTSQRIRISNALVTNGWNVSIAATGGPASLWTSGASYYDFNDASACSDGSDVDAWAGRLTVNPSVSTVTPSGGSCTNTGVSKGSSAAFSEAVTNAITLVSANATSNRFCYWDVTGVALTQQIPARTPAGTYALDMTITVTAQ